ncbi:MAG TPA: YbjQ family protein [Firmicutes bacterium]|nr:YbjQ family protein [Bacillota bacterium]
MILVNTPEVPGRRIAAALGLVMGSTVRSKHIGKDITAGLRTLVGGEIKEYTEMLEDARKEAIGRMVKEAQALGADAVVNIRFVTAQTMSTAAEILAYGTAVRLE